MAVHHTDRRKCFFFGIEDMIKGHEDRSRVTTRRGAPLSGSRCHEDILPPPAAGRKRARALSTSSCGQDLAIALDVRIRDQAAEADLPPPSPILSPVTTEREPTRVRPRKLSK